MNQSLPIASIELRAWRQFVAVAEELHFGRAAMRLHMTQPPLTQAIAALEQQLGAPLFERTSRRVALTAVGQTLLPEARALLLRAQDLLALARASAQGEAGRIRLAFVSTVGFAQLPQWVRAFRLAHPQIALELVEATGDWQLEALAQGTVDAGLLLHGADFNPAGLERLRVAHESLVLAVPAQHPLVKDTENDAAVPWAAVLHEPLVLFPHRILPSVHEALYALYQALGAQPQVAQEAIQMQTIVNLVSAGLGLAFVPESVVQFQRPGVVYRRLAAPPQKKGHKALAIPACETWLVWRSAAAHPALQRFVNFVRAQEAPS